MSVPRERPTALDGLNSAISAELVARVSQILLLYLIAHVLGAEGLGIFGVGWGLYAIAQSFVQSGPELIGVRAVAAMDLTASARRWAIEITLLKISFAVVAAGGIILLAAVVYSDTPAVVRQTALQALVLLAGALNTTWMFRGLGQMPMHGGLRAFQAVATLCVTMVILTFWPTPEAVPVAELIALIVTAAIAWGRLRPFIPEQGALAAAPRRIAMALEALTLGLASFCNTFIWTAMLPIAGLFLDASAVGFLTAALRLTTALNAGAQPVFHVFHQMLSRRFASGGEGGPAMAGRLTLYVGVTAIIGTLLLLGVSGPLTRLLFGSVGDGAAVSLRWLLPALIPSMIGAVFGYVLLAANQINSFTLISVGAAFLSLLVYWVGYDVFGAPAAGGLTVVVTFQAVFLGGLAIREGLLLRSGLHWRNLSPQQVLTFLRER